MVRVREEKRIVRLRCIKRAANEALGNTAAQMGTSYAASLFQTSKSRAKYWKRKILEPEWKKAAHGGSGRHQFHPEMTAKITAIILQIVDSQPTSTYRVYRRAIKDQLCFQVSLSYVKSLIASLGLTYVVTKRNLCFQPLLITISYFAFRWKVPQTKQINKYSLQNMAKYDLFVEWINSLYNQGKMSCIKFLDEAHFQARGASINTFMSPIIPYQ